MDIKYNGTIDLAVGMSARSKVWKNKKYTWSELIDRLMEEHKTTETYKEYIGASKPEQLKIKDVGGYVGGYLRNGRRKPGNVQHRQLMTLDIDFAHKDFWVDYLLQFENAALLHATHRHTETSPRYRLIIPLSRETTPDEYVAVSRAIAGALGIDFFDNTTFETNRLMFWPSSPKDVEYYAVYQDGPWIDVDEVLDTYIDWRDTSLWPTAESKFQDVKDSVDKQEDPENKKGVVGAFCRAFTIDDVIENFLSKDYVDAGKDRYTYTKGSAAAGLIVYDNKFAFSHHGTDPTGGKLCNAFDLVRIHKFGHLDPDDVKRSSIPKSFKAMEDFATGLKEVKSVIATEKISEARYDFAEEIENVEEDLGWMQELDVDAKGKYLSTATNINTIFGNDPRLKGIFKHNSFDNKRYVFKSLPWRRVDKPEPVKNVDYAGVRNYIESIYGIVGNLKIEDSMSLEFEKHLYHPVQDYLQELEWDGTKRIDTLLIDFFGAEDNLYTREATRKTLVGGVGRILRPGIKFDLVLTLVGGQGAGKSTLVKKLGKTWYSDTFMTVHGKEALEQIQGAWLIEMAELSGVRKSEVEAVKHFISKQEDTFRPAYGRNSETYLRQCIFIATTNNKDFLRDPSGNRRFLPIDLNIPNSNRSIFKDLSEQEVDQLWAEAVHLFKKGEPLYLSKEAEGMAKEEQKNHSETDYRKGIIETYLNTELPEDWGKMDLDARRSYLTDPEGDELSPIKKTTIKSFVCVAEIWCECLGKNKEDMDRYKTREVNDILRSLDDWEQSTSTKNFKIYGKQKYYSKKNIK